MRVPSRNVDQVRGGWTAAKPLCSEPGPYDGHYVYVLRAPGRELYVGRTERLKRRLGEHMSEPVKRKAVTKIELIRCDSLSDAIRIERALIELLKPELNSETRVMRGEYPVKGRV